MIAWLCHTLRPGLWRGGRTLRYTRKALEPGCGSLSGLPENDKIMYIVCTFRAKILRTQIYLPDKNQKPETTYFFSHGEEIDDFLPGVSLAWTDWTYS